MCGRFNVIDSPGLQELLRDLGLDYTLNRVGAMLCQFFTAGPVNDFASATRADTERFKAFFWAALERGVYFAPSQFECILPSAVHSDEDIERTIEVHRESLEAVH